MSGVLFNSFGRVIASWKYSLCVAFLVKPRERICENSILYQDTAEWCNQVLNRSSRGKCVLLRHEVVRRVEHQARIYWEKVYHMPESVLLDFCYSQTVPFFVVDSIQLTISEDPQRASVQAVWSQVSFPSARLKIALFLMAHTGQHSWPQFSSLCSSICIEVCQLVVVLSPCRPVNFRRRSRTYDDFRPL